MRAEPAAKLLSQAICAKGFADFYLHWLRRLAHGVFMGMGVH